jgi:hypothetical protein
MESGKVVNGFGPITSRYNLATNGSFLINQRAMNVNAWGVVKANDFVADCWKVDPATNVDYLETNNWTGGYLYLRGRGKKGQTISIFNIPVPLLGFDVVGNFTTEGAVVTAAADFQVSNGYVPVNCVASPIYGTSGVELLQKPANLTKGQGGTAVRIMKWGPASNPQAYGFVAMTLQGTGDFIILLSNFRMLYGAFANPPSAKVHPSEDLLRCKRYYQTGEYDLVAKAIQLNSSNTYARYIQMLPLSVEMAGTPSCTRAVSVVYAYDGAGAGSDRTSQLGVGLNEVVVGGVSSRSIYFGMNWSDTTYSANMYTNGFRNTFTWTATV